MSEISEPLKEEVFDFPEYASLVNPNTPVAYAMKFLRRVSEPRLVDVGFHDGESFLAYDYQTTSSVYQAILLRSVWFRPEGPLDGARPLKIQVLVDHEIVLEEDVDLHTSAGHFPFQRRPCSCNGWGSKRPECECPATPLRNPSGSCLFSAARVESPTLEDPMTFTKDEYGIFAPNGTLVQVKVVKGHSEPVGFKARCGITAALYSTDKKDFK